MKYIVPNGELLKRFLCLCPDMLTDTIDAGTIVVGAVDDTLEAPEPVGILLAHVNDSMVDIDWIYVREEYRRRYVGSEMMMTLMSGVRGQESIEAMFVTCPESSTSGLEFFKSIGVELEFGGPECELRSTVGESMKPAPENNDPHIIKMAELPIKAIMSLSIQVAESDTIVCSEKLPLDRAGYIEESLAFYDNDRIIAIVLLKLRADVLELRWAYSKHDDAKFLGMILNECHRRVVEHYPAETPVRVGAVRQESMKLLEHYLPNAKKIRIAWNMVDIDDVLI